MLVLVSRSFVGFWGCCFPVDVFYPDFSRDESVAKWNMFFHVLPTMELPRKTKRGSPLPSSKLTWQWISIMINRGYIFKWLFSVVLLVLRAVNFMNCPRFFPQININEGITDV